MSLRDRFSTLDMTDNAPESSAHDSEPPPYTPAPTSVAPTPRSQPRFASISMHYWNTIRFLHFPNPIVNLCREVITQSWDDGIRREKVVCGAHEFELHGAPWLGGKKQSSETRKIFCRLLGALHNQGWVLVVSTTTSRQDNEKATLMFRHQSPEPVPCEWAAVGFPKHDRIRFVDAPLQLPDALVAKLGPRWVRKRATLGPGVHEIAVFGSPWWPHGKQVMEARELLLRTMEVLENEGWSVYASVEQSGKDGLETDTWNICRPLGWNRGMPSYHG